MGEEGGVGEISTCLGKETGEGGGVGGVRRLTEEMDGKRCKQTDRKTVPQTLNNQSK